MRCRECGREAMNPEANFCDYCGSSFRQYGEALRTEEKTQESGGYSAFGTAEGYRGEESSRYGSAGSATESDAKPVTIWTFLGVMMIIFVPYIGFYAFLGILLYWGFSSAVDGVRKTFARAMLVFAVLMLILMVFSLSVMMQSGAFDSILQQMGITY